LSRAKACLVKAAHEERQQPFGCPRFNSGGLRVVDEIAVMDTESEIKFEVSPHDLQKLAATRILKRADGEPAKQKYLVSTYFDTPKQKLKQNGVSLRVRQEGKKRLQTIKTTSDGISFRRGEWERKLDSDEPDLRAARGTALHPLISKKLKRDLKSIFATHVHRTLIPLRPRNGSRVELALDEGHVRAGQKSTPLAEVELELKKGGVTDLFKVARVVAKLVPVKLALRSTSQQGYDLIADQPPRCVHAPRIVLQHDARLTEAFQAIGSSVLWHLAANEPAVEAGDPDGVHQMRVGVRRLRATISVFAELLRGKQTDQLKRDLKWLAGKLGPVRDLDVFIQTKVKPLDGVELPIPGLPALISELDYRRALAADSARDAIAATRYRFLIFNSLEWIENGDWLKKSRQGEQQIKPFAAHLFTRRTRKARKKSKHISRLDPRRRHKIRIAMKKLRYAIYFFESLFEGVSQKPLSRYKECLKSLQDNLGALNDIAVHQKLAANIAARKEGGAPKLVAYAAGVVAGSERNEVEPLLIKVKEAAHQLRRAKKFWT
jgi:triphosphatase